MKRNSWLALATLVLVSACKVERTPDEYFDKGSREAAERASAAAEVRDRVLAMGQALSRGNAADALVALSPARDVYIVGPQAGLEVRGDEQIAAVLRSLASEPIPVETRAVEVVLAPGSDVAWFRGMLEATRPGSAFQPVRITGVFVLNEGAWQLVQAHLSAPTIPPTSPAPSSPEASAADSAAAE